MIISPIEQVPNLWYVQQVYDENLLDKFLAEAHQSYFYTMLHEQENWKRKNYQQFPASSVWNSLLNSVDYGPTTALKFTPVRHAFWIDSPGFFAGIHEDNKQVVASQQIYLDTLDNAGTVFYDYQYKPLYRVPYKRNTGYFMINCGQLHGFPYPILQTRRSTYTWFNKIG